MYNKDEVWRLVCFTIISQLGVYGHSLHSTPRGPPGTRDLHYSVTFITPHYIHTTYTIYTLHTDYKARMYSGSHAATSQQYAAQAQVHSIPLFQFNACTQNRTNLILMIRKWECYMCVCVCLYLCQFEVRGVCVCVCRGSIGQGAATGH